MMKCMLTNPAKPDEEIECKYWNGKDIPICVLTGKCPDDENDNQDIQ